MAISDRHRLVAFQHTGTRPQGIDAPAIRRAAERHPAGVPAARADLPECDTAWHRDHLRPVLGDSVASRRRAGLKTPAVGDPAGLEGAGMIQGGGNGGKPLRGLHLSGDPGARPIQAGLGRAGRAQLSQIVQSPAKGRTAGGDPASVIGTGGQAAKAQVAGYGLRSRGTGERTLCQPGADPQLAVGIRAPAEGSAGSIQATGMGRSTGEQDEFRGAGKRDRSGVGRGQADTQLPLGPRSPAAGCGVGDSTSVLTADGERQAGGGRCWCSAVAACSEEDDEASESTGCQHSIHGWIPR
jgi:hypothetical protein